jgi:hypothetical protein
MFMVRAEVVRGTKPRPLQREMRGRFVRLANTLSIAATIANEK